MAENLSGRELQNEVTPYALYANRRSFLKAVGAAGTLTASAAAYRWFNPVRKMELDTANIDELATVKLTKEQRLERGFLVDEAMTSESNIITTITSTSSVRTRMQLLKQRRTSTPPAGRFGWREWFISPGPF